MGLKAYLIIALIGAWLASSGFAYYKGYQYKASLCNTENLEAKISTLEKELKISKDAVVDADRREKILLNEAETDNTKLEEYETALKDAPACRATQSDVDQLR